MIYSPRVASTAEKGATEVLYEFTLTDRIKPIVVSISLEEKK
jgi:hypothetical protein